jgi:hypothetical protein
MVNGSDYYIVPREVECQRPDNDLVIAEAEPTVSDKKARLSFLPIRSTNLGMRITKEVILFIVPSL